MYQKTLVECLKDNCPHSLKNESFHLIYTRFMLKMAKKCPKLTKPIMKILADRFSQMDAEIKPVSSTIISQDDIKL
jgi:hypothetical protein